MNLLRIAARIATGHKWQYVGYPLVESSADDGTEYPAQHWHEFKCTCGEVVYVDDPGVKLGPCPNAN